MQFFDTLYDIWSGLAAGNQPASRAIYILEKSPKKAIVGEFLRQIDWEGF